MEGAIGAGAEAVSFNGGDVTVNVGDVTLHQYAGNATYGGAGIRTATTGTTNITAGNVVTTGDYTDGIKAGDNSRLGGDTTVTVTSVATTGNYFRRYRHSYRRRQRHHHGRQHVDHGRALRRRLRL